MIFKEWSTTALPDRSFVHLVGIGGIGMSGLARWFLSQKWDVSGSDAVGSEITRELKNEGVNVKIGHKKGILPRSATLVVRSQAIPNQNPEIQEALSRNIRVLSYPEAIGALTRRYSTIAISGAHGKSTTAALVSLILVGAGFDPTVIIGTKLKEFGGKNFRAGRSRYLVLEADEYGRAFLNYSPALAVITNIDREHLDTYRDMRDIKRAFTQFLRNMRERGTIVLNRDNPALVSLRSRIAKIAAEKHMRVLWYSRSSRDEKKIAADIRIPGSHNASNALAAFTLARAIGVKPGEALNAIRSFRGSWRRMEYRGKWQIAYSKSQIVPNKKKPFAICHLRVYDDYAHHPTEIKATLAAFKEKYLHSPIICVFQPHQADRLKKLFREFVGAFADADALILLPTYKVAGRDPGNSKYDSPALAAAIRKKHPQKPIVYLRNPKKLRQSLVNILQATSYKLQAVVVMMGAGDIVNYADYLVRKR